MSQACELKKIDGLRWKITKSGAMRTEGLIYASEKMVPHICAEKAAEQVSNVATLLGIVGNSMAMPDIHWGYGFPIGGVAAFDIDNGIISPGGVGYDINCGVRLIRTNLKKNDIRISELLASLLSNVPSGVGSTGRLALAHEEVKKVLSAGAAWVVKKGYGSQDDIRHTEESGCMAAADHSCVSNRAIDRGKQQLGTLGAGNHFIEIQEVVEIYDQKAAAIFGLFEKQITAMLHTGSRGLGYQICDDYLKILQTASQKYNIALPDRQLACAPINSDEGKRYYAAMSAAANYAWANRQLITYWLRESLSVGVSKSRLELGLEVVYDVAHNIAKFEEHTVSGAEAHGGMKRRLLVHRKGATRAFAAGHNDLPADYKSIGQPVIVPGTMGTESYVLVGTQGAMTETWGSTCHGAGRTMSRTQISRQVRGEHLKNCLAQKGIEVLSESFKTLAEEAPEAYKDVSEVVDICHKAGISKKVARMRPLGVIKG